MLRPWWLVICLLCLGCHTLLPLDLVEDGNRAEELWQKGQTAMQEGTPERAIGFYERSLQADPALTRNHLSLAAACLEAGKEEEACGHLGRYLDTHPDHLEVRRHYAELLLKVGLAAEARTEYLRFVSEAQEKGDEELAPMVHCLSRLVELAEAIDDEYAAHLYRGIGLYQVARQRAGAPDPDDELPLEGLLCKSAGELSLARTLRPKEARPCWYLQRVWARLGQKQTATRWLREASAAAPFTYLTPAEQRGLMLACRAQESEGRR